MQLLLGTAGIGKTTMLNNMGRLILQRLDKDQGWLSEYPGFRECVEYCLAAEIPYVFTLVDTAALFFAGSASRMLDKRPGRVLCNCSTNLLNAEAVGSMLDSCRTSGGM